MSNDTHPSEAPRASVSVDVTCDPSMEYVNRLDSAFRAEGSVLEDGDLETTLCRQKTLIKEIALTEAHIESLRNGLKNWITLTDAARKMLGRYHTQEDISRTLRRQEAFLRFLRSEINCAEYKIEAYRPRENLTRSPTCIAEQ